MKFINKFTFKLPDIFRFRRPTKDYLNCYRGHDLSHKVMTVQVQMRCRQHDKVFPLSPASPLWARCPSRSPLSCNSVLFTQHFFLWRRINRKASSETDTTNEAQNSWLLTFHWAGRTIGLGRGTEIQEIVKTTCQKSCNFNMNCYFSGHIYSPIYLSLTITSWIRNKKVNRVSCDFMLSLGWRHFIHF